MTTSMEGTNGWKFWREQIQKDVRELRKGQDDIRVVLAELRTELRWKVSFWGLIAGGIPVAILLLVRFLS